MGKRTNTLIQVLFISFFAFVSLFLLLLQFGFIRYNESPSMPYGFYIKTVQSKLKEGSVVLLENPRSDLSDSTYLIKRIDHFEGDKAYLKGSTSQEIYKRCGIKDLYSLDSDYFGLIEINKLTKLRPLLTWNKLL